MHGSGGQFNIGALLAFLFGFIARFAMVGFFLNPSQFFRINTHVLLVDVAGGPPGQDFCMMLNIHLKESLSKVSSRTTISMI